MELISNPKVKTVFDQYPNHVRIKMNYLRTLVIEVAGEIDGLKSLEETLKWGEPSYITKHGSTLRMDWKEKTPDQYALYFSCTTKLVPTFRKIYKDVFNFEGNRAIVFCLDEKIPEDEVKHCIQLALTYHKVKKELLLGA
ncbi:DUF1801 domain-containing protein [Spongiivirga sp. MCCC 1A20706]|uniref:DUF1801 domain-containing protein n=1 Tax=Spongiivirga sp. MCCC 1A20706 TaxID=3160963 RepID=UPI0039774ED6